MFGVKTSNQTCMLAPAFCLGHFQHFTLFSILAQNVFNLVRLDPLMLLGLKTSPYMSKMILVHVHLTQQWGLQLGLTQSLQMGLVVSGLVSGIYTTRCNIFISYEIYFVSLLMGQVCISVYYMSHLSAQSVFQVFYKKDFFSYLGEELGHLQEKIGFVLWRGSKSTKLNSCQRKQI